MTKFKVGDLVGVGCMVDSCRTARRCSDGLEQYCDNGFIGTYNGPDSAPASNTYGGYSDRIVVDESFVLRIAHDELDLAAVAPLLCAGITTYSPLRHWKVGPGQKVGIVGLGGLGHMGVKFAAAMGAHVVLFTTSPEQARGRAAARRARGRGLEATPDEMAAHAGSFDFILDTVSAPHDINAYLDAAQARRHDDAGRRAGDAASVAGVFNLIFGAARLAGSLIGGIAETQEMLDFCAEHGIVSDIEMIRMRRDQRRPTSGC